MFATPGPQVVVRSKDRNQTENLSPGCDSAHAPIPTQAAPNAVGIDAGLPPTPLSAQMAPEPLHQTLSGA